MAELPNTMRSPIAPKPCKPSGYELADLPIPLIRNPDEMLIRVHAAGFTTGDTLVAAGLFRLICKTEFPSKIGIECAGTVVSAGPSVTNFKPGDAVYGMAFGRPMDFTRPPAAGLLGFTLTAYESLELAARHMAARGKQLEGSTVFVPGALSATGAVAVQLLKNVYGVKKLVATVSTPKVALVEQHLPGLVDQVVDYKTTPTLTSAVPAGSVDFAYNTQQSSLESLIPLVNKDTGVVISIASVFPSRLLRLALGPALPFWAAWLADLLQLYYRWLIRGTSIELDFVSGNAGDREIVEKTAEVIALRKVKCVMRVVDLEDIDSLRKACGEVYSGKGGLGKLVVKIV